MSASIEGFRGFCTPRVGAAEFMFPRPIAARIGASEAEIWASEVRQAAPGHTTAATRSARPTHSPVLSYRARCGGPIGLDTLLRDAPTLSSACAPLLQMAHPSWFIRLQLECRNVAPTVFSAQSSGMATHAFGLQLWAIPHVLARHRLAFVACFRELRLESLPWIIMGRGRARGSLEPPPVVAAAGNDRGIGG